MYDGGWFISYLSDRNQRVVLNGVKSSPLPTKAGVPQGSVLGPILFLVYAKNLETDIFLFADDTTPLDKKTYIKLKGGQRCG
jgi:hypothetical protein